MNIKLRFPRSSLAIAILSVVAFLVLIALTAFFLVHFYSEYLWYDQLGFTGVIVTQWAAIFVVFCLAFVFVSIFCGFVCSLHTSFAHAIQALVRYLVIIRR